ncbi:MAG: hypothetical protein WC575_02845 [Patescibacteria group bacterium]
MEFDFNFAIPYSAFLIVYIIAIAIILFFTVASLHHLLRYGFFSPTAVFMTFLLIAGTAFILFISFSVLSGVNWHEELTIGQAYNSFNPF